jgi:hypothetical protein
MWSRHLKRQLTPAEAKAYAEHRCIVCGQTVEPFENYRHELCYPIECLECAKMGGYPWNGRSYGARGASMGNEFRRRMGYSSRAGAAPEFDSAGGGGEPRTEEVD